MLLRAQMLVVFRAETAEAENNTVQSSAANMEAKGKPKRRDCHVMFAVALSVAARRLGA